MQFSTTYLSTIVMFLAFLAKVMGVEVGSEQLTTTVEVIVAFVAGVWILIERFKKGGITAFGTKINA